MIHFRIEATASSFGTYRSLLIEKTGEKAYSQIKVEKGLSDWKIIELWWGSFFLSQNRLFHFDILDRLSSTEPVLVLALPSWNGKTKKRKKILRSKWIPRARRTERGERTWERKPSNLWAPSSVMSGRSQFNRLIRSDPLTHVIRTRNSLEEA